MSDKSDCILLQTLITYCQCGQLFYQTMAKRETNLALASLFRELSEVRGQAVAGLRKAGITDETLSAEHGNPVDSVFELYALFPETPYEKHRVDVLSQLDNLETRVLLWFGEGVRKLTDHEIAEEMAVHIASLQIAHDSLKSIRLKLETVTS